MTEQDAKKDVTANPDAHIPVLRDEAIAALMTDLDGCYVDCTYGRGGHTALILEQLSGEGRLLVIDKDMAAISDARQKYTSDPRVIICHGSFADLAEFVAEHELPPLTGVLLDLGISSPQINHAARGFSFDRNGPLDMRMDQTQGRTASDWVMQAEEQEIIDVLRNYGEERFARRIAQAILVSRVEKVISTTHELVAIIDAAVPRIEFHKHPATRSFQAIRIYINNELGDVETTLDSAFKSLAIGGRLVVISFHSLEDRIVKRFMRDLARGQKLPDRLPIRDSEIRRTLKLIGKAIKPSEAEVSRNRRSRSSIMRIAEKLL
ncbi:MAG: 16S rRNA (cytosine1402-N4)-methyltransferase [Candidatus Pseudothioglobus sp.]|jgi:16S rRNA (cytosine1402-N4)-methyltransferase